MKWNTYSEYKDSNVEWLGKIPKHWQLKSIRRVTKAHKQGYYSQEDYIDEGVKLARITDIDDSGCISFLNMPYVQITENDERAFKINHGDILFARSGTIGRFGLAENPGRSVFASYLIRFVFVISNLQYVKYFFLSKYFKESLLSTLHGGANQNVHAENIKDQWICIAPNNEQDAIAAFLDRMTGHIDTLIAKKERQIELLQEKRIALISHAVTKGLDPNIKVKDSGIDWLGNVPTRWEVKRLRFSIKTNPTKSEVSRHPDDISVSFIPMESIGEYGGLRLDQTKPLQEVSNGYTYFQDGDVLVAKITPCFENGKGAIAEGLENCIGFGTTELHVLRPKHEIDKQYLFYLTISHAFRCLGSGYMYGAGGQKRVPEDFIRNLKHPIPLKDEQCVITAYLDQETTKIDLLIAKIEGSINKLREYRTALISAAVTGKIDVQKEPV